MKKKQCDIFICTHNRHKELIGTLKSLKGIGKHKVYIIDSSDKKLNKKYQKLCNEYIYDRSKKALSKKRNLAVKLSKADYIAFTDDDCIVDKNWINELLKGFGNKRVVCCTGRTLAYKNYESREYEKRYSFDKIGVRKKLISKKLFFNPWRIGHGNNMIFKKNVFKDVGLFDIDLGVGAFGLAGEDTDMFYRILKKGYKIYHNPLAIIYHKHLTKNKDMPKIAYRNGHATKLILYKNIDINCIFLYAALLTKSIFRYLIKFDKVDKFFIKGLVKLGQVKNET